MEQEELRAWVRILRDLTLVVVGAFMLVFETVLAPLPNPYLIGAGLAALGLPPVIRLDELRRKPE